jgi:transposase
VHPNHRRANVGVISAVTNKGELRWMVLDGAINAPLLIDFLARPIGDADGKMFLILDNLRVRRARLVQDWLVEYRAQIEVFYLPSCSPEINPNEGVNANIKQADPHPARHPFRENFDSGTQRNAARPTSKSCGAVTAERSRATSRTTRW